MIYINFSSMLQFMEAGNIDLFLVGVTSIAILLLGFIVFFNNRTSVTNQTFLLVAVAATFYGFFNYINYQVSSHDLVLWFIRLTVFFAVWYAFSLFQLFYVFPEKRIIFSKTYKFVLLPVVAVTSLLTLTPFVFPHLAEHAPLGTVSTPAAAWGAFAFGVVSLFLVLGAVYLLARKTWKATGIVKRQFYLVLTGASLTFGAIIIFNLLFTLLLGNTSLISWTPVFTLPFVVLTAYSIFQYKMLNTKIIATEILTFVLAIVVLLEVIFAQDMFTLLFRVAIFILVSIFSILLIRSVHREIDQRERLERLTEKLSEANKHLKELMDIKTEFLQIASHQLRTPLSALRGWLQMQADGDLENYSEDDKKEVHRNMLTSVNNLNTIVDDLLDAMELEGGSLNFNIEDVDVEKLIQEAIDTLKPRYKEKNLTIAFKPSGLPKIKSDERYLRQVFLNIINNAEKYTEKGGLTITTAVKDAMVEILFTDTGIGIDPEDIPHLFGKFVRGKKSPLVHANGSGLGLYIIKKIVDEHHGTVALESEGVGKGTTVRVLLPIG